MTNSSSKKKTQDFIAKLNSHNADDLDYPLPFDDLSCGALNDSDDDVQQGYVSILMIPSPETQS